MLSPLDELAEKWGSGKAAHNYLPLYWRHFRDLRETARRVLEIGVSSGDSLRLWEEFFPNATIYGVDIDPECRQHASERIEVITGDQGDPDFLASLPGDLDVVIDDGSHRVAHQILGVQKLLPRVCDGGVYVVEDLEDSDYRRPVLEFLKGLVDNVNYWPKGYSGSDWQLLNTFPEDAGWWDRNVLGVSFYRYIAFIDKGPNPQAGEAAHRLRRQGDT